jgi:heptosyltransferase-1
VNSGEGGAPRSLLVVRLGAMGDVIHALPAVAALRAALPGTKIGWVIEERWAELLCAHGKARAGPPSSSKPLVDMVHALDTKRWRKSLLSSQTWGHIFGARAEIRGEGYEVAADFQGAIKSAMVASLSRANVAGMRGPREAPAKLFYDRLIRTRGGHVIEQNVSLAEAVAHKALRPGRAIFPANKVAEWGIAERISAVGEPFILIAPGAGWGAKQWPAERYGQVAKRLASKGYRSLINFAPSEVRLADAVAAASGGTSVKISTGIGELIALTRRAKLFIGGDTGPMHLAAALGVPVVALFGPTDPARNGPYGTINVVLRNAASQTSFSHVNAADPGLVQITVEEVVSAAMQLLEHSNV